MRIIMVVAVVAVLVAACTGSTNYWIPYTAARGSTQLDRGPAVQAAVVAITDAGREVESSDAASGTVMSKWFSGDGFGQDLTRFRIRVTFSDGGAYEIVALCQGKDTGPLSSGGWKDCEEKDKRPRFVADVLTKVEANLRAAKPSAATAQAAQQPAQPRGFYCASGNCARDKEACEQARIAANDGTVCALVEGAFCFALSSGGESCAPSADTCGQRKTTAGASASGDCFERK